MDKLESVLKHKKYFSSYKPNDLFWGIGIENETYIEIPNSNKVDGKFIIENHKRERYSVDYFDGYLSDYFSKAIRTLYNENDTYTLPLLLNSHGLTKCDIYGEHKTTYSKQPKPNPKFSGKTAFEYMCEKDSYFSKEYEKSYCFDGDTVEFMTLNFYKTTINKVIDELKHEKKEFLTHFNNLDLPICNNTKALYPSENHGFAILTTNPKNLAIFNNGTYHFNFTLPTQLDENGNIKNIREFVKNHKVAVRFIQFFEPFFIALYGSPDPLSKSPVYTKRFPKGSQRVSASRYISAGTYNSSKMISGKLLQTDSKDLLKSTPPHFWYKQLYNQIHYKINDKIGFDINFNKFKNHGIELRFFEWFDESLLHEVLETIVYILDLSQDNKSFESQTHSKHWNDILYRVLLDGKNVQITVDELVYMRKILKLNIHSYELRIDYVFKEIISELKEKYKHDGFCSKYMLEKPIIKTSNKCCSIM